VVGLEGVRAEIAMVETPDGHGRLEQAEAQARRDARPVRSSASVMGDVLDAADNNVRWCDAVCRSHGLATRFVDDLWIAPEGSPQFYPDVVTLRPGASSTNVVTHMPPRAESVKDSFACLDLAPEGFGVLFDARWIVHRSPRSAAPALVWTPVDSAGELDDWTTAAGLEGIIRADLVAEPTIRIFAGRHSDRGPIVAGAIANATGRVVGVSNVFSEQPDAKAVWRDLQGIAAIAFPGRHIVGYEHGDDLAHAVESGFSPLQPLRIWYRERA
jgi:hypothetical protein